MTYLRVVPRDLFNEGNLLKCLGRVYICAEQSPLGDPCAHVAVETGGAWCAHQDQSDGSLWLDGVQVSCLGYALRCARPMNSRDPWPLYVCEIDGEEIDPVDVFTDEGEFSDDFRALCDSLPRP